MRRAGPPRRTGVPAAAPILAALLRMLLRLIPPRSPRPPPRVVVLDDVVSLGPPSARHRPHDPLSTGSATSQDAQRQLMLDALNQLLGRHPATRGVMPQLALVERALRSPAPKVLDELPMTTVDRALAQLERLVSQWSPGLAKLRSTLAVSLLRREATERNGGVGRGVSSAHPADAPDVSEVGVSSFMAAEHRWAGAARPIQPVPARPR